MHSQRPRNKQQQRITANDCDVGLRCRDIPIQVRPTFIQCAAVPPSYRCLFKDDGYFVIFVLCGRIRRLIDTTDAPGRYVPTSRIAGKRTGAGTEEFH